MGLLQHTSMLFGLLKDFKLKDLLAPIEFMMIEVANHFFTPGDFS